MTYPTVTIVMTTYFPPEMPQRRLNAQATLDSWEKYLNYSGEILLHVADDGTPMTPAPDMPGGEWTGVLLETKRFRHSKSHQTRRGVGASLNRGMEAAFNVAGGLALYAVDDWALTAPLDLDPWARLLEADPTIGCVRLGIAHPGLTGTVEFGGDRGCEYLLRIDRHHFAFATRPFLMHRRFYDAYGPFLEGVNSFDVEVDYNTKFCDNAYRAGHGEATLGPDVVLGLVHPWVPFDDDATRLSHVVPG